MGKLREIVDTMIRQCEYSLRSGNEMEWPKGKRGERYWLQTLVHRHYIN
jgi:hypothetical protein